MLAVQGFQLSWSVFVFLSLYVLSNFIVKQTPYKPYTTYAVTSMIGFLYTYLFESDERSRQLHTIVVVTLMYIWSIKSLRKSNQYFLIPATLVCFIFYFSSDFYLLLFDGYNPVYFWWLLLGLTLYSIVRWFAQLDSSQLTSSSSESDITADKLLTGVYLFSIFQSRKADFITEQILYFVPIVYLVPVIIVFFVMLQNKNITFLKSDEQDESDDYQTARHTGNESEEELLPVDEHSAPKPKRDAKTGKKSRTKKITGAIRATFDYHRDPISKLDKMIGMNEVKNQLQGILSLYQLEQQQKRNGDQIDGSVNHMVFYGNPGTGKTTVARIVAEILHTQNMTQTNNFVEVTRQDLIGQYIGQSAPKLNEAVKKAAGGILFIDEAYTLYIPESPNDFGHEIIAELLGVLENNNDNIIVIIAGYEKEIDAFLKSNPGLESRFNTKVHFPDYTISDLMKIFDTFLTANTLTITPSARARVEHILTEQRLSPTFANARAVRNIFQKCKKQYAKRIDSTGKLPDYKSVPINEDDVQL